MKRAPIATRPLEVRFWSKVRKGEDCWEWTGFTRKDGYGLIGLGRRSDGIARAHRVAWELHFGPIPDGLYVCHRCDNRKCVRPDHLFLGTPQDNVDDMVRKGRSVAPSSPSGLKNHKAVAIAFGGETMCIAEWERRLHMAPGTLRKRLRDGWSLERAFTEPVRTRAA